jgi:hypothetical protein
MIKNTLFLGEDSIRVKYELAFLDLISVELLHDAMVVLPIKQHFLPFSSPKCGFEDWTVERQGCI